MKKILWVLLIIVLIVFISGCGKKHPYYSCENDEECLSNRCIEGHCDYSVINGSCKYDFDCKKGEGICKDGICAKSKQGERCVKPEDCIQGTFCFKRENKYEGECIKDNSLCRFFAEKFGLSTFIVIFGLFVIIALLYFGVESLLGINLLTIHGVSITLLGAIITSWFIYYILLSGCM